MQQDNRNNNDLLNKVKLISKDALNEITYDTWIAPLKLISVEESKITMTVPTDFYATQVKLYEPLLCNCFRKALNTKIEYKFNFISLESHPNYGNTFTASSNNSHINSNIDSKFTFNNFVIGDNNRFAHAASLAVSEAPGTFYNPLFIYGRVGLGKTHLMHAIGNEILRTFPDKKVLYVTSETFTNEFINGIKDKSDEKFREKYRNLDVLLIDDIQFIAGKEGTQEEFFHTFNTICEHKGQLVLTSDKPPKDINPLEDRLKSRFGGGILVDISAANYETRLAILRKKVQLENIIIDDLVLSNIATKVDSNIRELEGTLKKIVAMASFMHSPITLELAEKAVADVVAHKEKVISPNYIKDVVSRYFNVPVDDIDSSKRSIEITYPRQIAMYLCRELAKMQYKKIGLTFGNKDHSTVMHACNKIEQEIKVNSETRSHVDNVKNIILQPQV